MAIINIPDGEGGWIQIPTKGYTPVKGVDYFDGKDANVTKTNVENALGHTVNKSVPSDAKFTDTVYTHPETHPASIILQNASNRFVSDAEKLAWNDKVDNSRVLTDVPANAKFTDTVYTHPTTAGNKHIPTGGASGQILRYSASGTAVWGNENNTTYTAGQGLTLTGTVFTPDFGTGAGKVVQGDDTRLSDARTPLAHNQAISTITGLQSALDGKVNNSQVLTDVPSGAEFTDTVTTVNGKTGAITKADIVALGIPEQDTVYTHPAGTNPHGTTKADVGLGDVNNTSDANKPVSTAQQAAINSGVAEAKTYADGKSALAIPLTQKGVSSGVAELDAEGIILSSQLPSYVDDVLEFATLANFPTTGESGKIYVAIDTNLTYRWTGTTYVEISPSIALGETSATAYRGDKGKVAYDHSQVAHAPSNAQKNSDITKAEIEAKLTGAITTHTHSAYVPTSRTVAGKALTGNITLAKGDVGLGNVDNTSDMNKPVSTAQSTAIGLKADKTYVDDKVSISNNRVSDIDEAFSAALNDLNSRLKTDVPVDAIFTDTIVDISGKVDKVDGKGLSTNDYTTDEKNKLSGIEAGANNYSLPTASTTVIGGVKVGTRVSIANGVLSADLQTANDFTTVLKNKLDGIEAEANKTTLSTSVTSTSTTTVATSSAVKSAYDRGSSGISKADTAQSRADSAWTLANAKWTYNASTIQGVKVDNATKADVLEGTINNYVEKLTTTTGAINLNSGNVFHRDATANTTFSITNAKAGAHSFTLIITMGATVRTLTFPASIKWADGEVPEMTEANKTYILTFMTINSGTTWFGMEGGSF